MTKSTAVLLGCLAPASLAAQQTATRLDGVWKVAEVTLTGDSGYTISSPQPGLMLFTATHYSLTMIDGPSARRKVDPPKDPARLSDAEKLARYEQWSLFTANAGTYQTRGDTLTYRALVAKSEAAMALPPRSVRFKVEGNTLWIVVPARNGAEFRNKLTRDG